MEPFQEAPSFSSSPTPRPPLSLVWRSLTSLFVAMWTRSPIYLFASCFLRRDASTAPTFSQRSFPPLSLSIPPPFVSPFSNDARFRTSAFPHLETFVFGPSVPCTPCCIFYLLPPSSPSLCPHAANVYLRGCWLQHGMQTGRLIKPPSTYIPPLLSSPRSAAPVFPRKTFRSWLLLLLYDHLRVYSSWFLAVTSLGTQRPCPVVLSLVLIR